MKVTISLKKPSLIGEQAFYYCSSLSSLTIPYNVRYIAQNAFQSCSKLKSVTFEDKTMNDPLLPYDLENKHWGLYKGCVLHYIDGDITIS